MKVNREWLKTHCRLTLRNENKDTPYSGCLDPAARAWVYGQIQRGYSWAWRTVEIRIDFKGLESMQYLGASSYGSEEAFLRCDDLEQLVRDGVEEIAFALETLSLEHGLWEHDPIPCVWCATT